MSAVRKVGFSRSLRTLLQAATGRLAWPVAGTTPGAPDIQATPGTPVPVLWVRVTPMIRGRSPRAPRQPAGVERLEPRTLWSGGGAGLAAAPETVPPARAAAAPTIDQVTGPFTPGSQLVIDGQFARF